jgi:hypothetical protein
LQLAAADPVAQPRIVSRAARQLEIDPQAATPAVDAGLFEIGAQVRFRHPPMRSAAYRSASSGERHGFMRRSLRATDPEFDPDRRAWHRAQASPGPDEEVAEELERSADRAQARGGIAAAASFLERAATLTPEPARRVRRLVAAARAKRDAGALDAARLMALKVPAGTLDAGSRRRCEGDRAHRPRPVDADAPSAVTPLTPLAGAAAGRRRCRRSRP